MKKYGVKAVAKLSHVSVRTLHYYDKIGLLKPFNRTEAGYRYYSEQELLRLQQILFYKELDFSLKEIGELLNDSNFNLMKALKSHKKELLVRKNRLSTLLKTIDRTIHHLKKEKTMSKPEDLYKGLSKEFGTTYRQEVNKKYGQAILQQSEQELLKLGKNGFRQLKIEFEELRKALFALHQEKPESERIQQLIAQHYKLIRIFWGTSNSKNKQGEAYDGLGQLYVSDERYLAIKGEPQPTYVLFMQKAMRYFVDNQLK